MQKRRESVFLPETNLSWSFKPNFHGFSLTSWRQLEHTEMNKTFRVYSTLRMTFSPCIWSRHMHIFYVFDDTYCWFYLFIGRTDTEAEALILWLSDARRWLIGTDPDAGKDWGQEEKGHDRGWDGWMASRTQWTRVWVNSGSWWWTGRPGVLPSTGSTKNCT